MRTSARPLTLAAAAGQLTHVLSSKALRAILEGVRRLEGGDPSGGKLIAKHASELRALSGMRHHAVETLLGGAYRAKAEVGL